MFTPLTRTRQDSFVLSCPCRQREQAVTDTWRDTLPIMTSYLTEDVNTPLTVCTAGLCDTDSEVRDTSSRWQPGNNNRRGIIRGCSQISNGVWHWHRCRHADVTQTQPIYTEALCVHVLLRWTWKQRLVWQSIASTKDSFHSGPMCNPMCVKCLYVLGGARLLS